MPRLCAYVPKDLAEEVHRRVEARGISVSRYITELLSREVEVGQGWPEGWFDEVVGGWQGEPLERPPEDRDPC